MSIKSTLAKTVRKIFPKNFVKKLEEFYRKLRVKIISAFYGSPAKKLRIIAVTGTNGKTTTVNFINEILKEAKYKTAMFSTANIEIGGEQILNDLNATVGSTARMQKFFKNAKKANADFVILEITSHALVQHKLDGIPIEAAIMTNLTQDHLDYHKTMENYAAAKAKLFKLHPEFIVLNSDDEWFDYFNKFEAEDQKITYGTNENAEVRIDSVKLYKKGSEANLTIDNNVRLSLATNLPGKFNVYNLAAAASVAYLLGVPLEDIQEGAANLEAVPGRFERAVEGENFDVIVDYAHTPDALEKLLEATKAITKNRVILVFGATGDRDKEKRPIMGKIASEKADRIFVTDEECYSEDPDQIRAEILSGMKNGESLPANVEEIPDRKDAIRKAISVAGRGDAVLLTGMGHEVFRIINGEKIPWNDAEIAREIVEEKKQVKL